MRSATLPLVLALVLCGLWPGAQAIAAAPAFAITEAQVLAALHSAGLSGDVTALHLPGTLFAAVADPGLRLAAAERFGTSGVRVRLTCQHGAECPAFFAQVIFPSSAQAQEEWTAMQAALQQQSSQHAPGQSTPALRVGQQTTLILEDGYMRVTLPVFAIDSGMPGAQVRVQTSDHKEVFQAVVTQAGLVRAALP